MFPPLLPPSLDGAGFGPRMGGQARIFEPSHKRSSLVEPSHKDGRPGRQLAGILPPPPEWGFVKLTHKLKVRESCFRKGVRPTAETRNQTFCIRRSLIGSNQRFTVDLILGDPPIFDMTGRDIPFSARPCSGIRGQPPPLRLGVLTASVSPSLRLTIICVGFGVSR